SWRERYTWGTAPRWDRQTMECCPHARLWTTALIETVETPAEHAALTDAAEGFMRRKVMAATEALAGGAARVIIADATGTDPLTAALAGAGTHISAAAIGADT
ncbi:MAG: hypothetical protein RI531_07335, partial [Haloferacaceae archaeon]|nr:hypothetical protein [Haloferacaceae archaeon]